MADKSQQTEKATPRRLEKAREEGRFPAAKELIGAVQFLAFVILVGSFGGDWIASLRRIMRLTIERAFRSELSVAAVMQYALGFVTQLLGPLILAGGGLVVLSVAARLATTRMGLNLKGLTPDFSRLNGFSRLKQLPSQNLPALMQALILLPVAAAAVCAVARDNQAAILALPFQDLETGGRAVGHALQGLLWKGAGVFVIFAIIDFFRQQRRYLKDLRMSKQDVRDELKEAEGNPQIKSRIRRIHRDLLRRRMMQDVPKATAVVVNPTHYAVAIQYDMDAMAAPRVLAKGKNYLAARIREKAMAHEIPIVENPPLARALYKSVEVGQEIPPHLYRAVAEILAYIYKLMNGRLPH